MVYGFSRSSRSITTVNIALRRQMYLLDYFTEGNIPDSLIGVPESWTPDQIASYQKYWDAYFDGDLGRRRRAKFVPGGVAKTFIQTKEPELKGPFDEWLARIVCFAFSISPQALTQPMNRATAETQKELAEEEGLARDPGLGESPDRRGHGGNSTRPISNSPSAPRRDRSADARDDPFKLHVERHPDDQRGARRARPRAAAGGDCERADGADGCGLCAAAGIGAARLFQLSSFPGFAHARCRRRKGARGRARAFAAGSRGRRLAMARRPAD